MASDLAGMDDRRRRAVALFIFALVAAACVPEAVSPNASGSLSPIRPTPTPTPSGPTPVPTFVPPTPTPAPTYMPYVVARGDTLTSIAKRFKTNPRSISFWNRALYPSLDPGGDKYSPNRIEIGWVLAIIPGSVIVDEQNLPAPAQPFPTPTPAPTASPPPSTSPSPTTSPTT